MSAITLIVRGMPFARSCIRATACRVNSSAATPPAGTLSESSREVSWTGGPKPSTQNADCGGPDNAACDNFQLTIEPPSFGFEVEIVLTVPGEGGETEVFFSDLSEEYVTYNASYTS